MIDLKGCDLATLERLGLTDADELGRAIAERLLTDEPTDFVRDLIRFTEHLTVVDTDVRSRLSAALFHVARVLSERVLSERGLAVEEATLFSAIRMAAVFATEPAKLGGLVYFMRLGHSRVPAHQAALQAIAHVSRRKPLPVVPELHDLTRAVEHSANRFGAADLLTIEGLPSLAIAALVAAYALRLPGTDARKEEFRFRHHPLLLSRLDRELKSLVSEWSPEDRRSADEAAALPLPPRNRRAALEWLEFPHQDTPDEGADGLEAPPRLQPPETEGRLPAYPRVNIGQEFTVQATGHRWRVTDVGTRTFAAIDLTAARGPDWLTGPPYAVTERVWDEYDCLALKEVEGIEWAVHGPRAALDQLLEKVIAFGRDWKAQEGCSAARLDAVLDAVEGYVGPLSLEPSRDP